MPLPRKLSLPFRRSSYTCSLIPFLSSKPTTTKSSSTTNNPKSNPNNKTTTADPPIRPHYFDTYTGTWSPRKPATTTPSRSASRNSGLWSPRQIASRIATPSRRPASPIAGSPPATPTPLSPGGTTIGKGTGMGMDAAAPTTPGREREMHQVRYQGYQHLERPPSRRKGGGGVASDSTTAASPGQPSLDWTRIMEEHEEGEGEGEGGDEGYFLAEEEPVSVTKVSLPAREDVRPLSRDWADPVGGWGVIDVVADGGGGVDGGVGNGEEGKVFLPAVVHEMSVLPVVDRVS